MANGPAKAGLRSLRCEELFDYFQNWKVERLKAQVDKKPLPKFQPPKPKIADGLRMMRKVLSTALATDKFEVGHVSWWLA